MPTKIEELEAREAEIAVELKTILDSAENEKRELTDVEDEKQVQLLSDIAEVREQITDLRQKEARRQAAAEIAKTVMPVQNRDRDEVYLPGSKGGKDSYFKDLADARKGERGAVDRLTRNDKRNAELEQRAGTTTVAGAGGEFAPPVWLIDEFVGLARPGRPFADLLNKQALPAGVSSINLPKITTGTATGVQSTQNTAITNQDIVTTSVSTSITTQAGGVTVSRQILDQSPVSMDEIILGDLARDLAQKIDLAAITAVAAVSGLNSVTYTDASPTSAKLMPYVQQAIDQVGLGIYTPNQLVAVVRTDRWGRFVAGADTTGRPFVLPSGAYGPFNARGIQSDAVTGQGYVGTLNSIPVVTDAQIPNNLGAGTNQDEIFVLDPSQIFLYESAPQAEAFEQTYANTLSVYCRIFEYYGIIANRLPKAISLITGTGLIPYTYGS